MNLNLPSLKGFLAFATAAFGCLPYIANSEEIPLETALYEALEQNLSLRINAYQTYLREQDLSAANAKFDTSLFGSVNISKEKQDWTQSQSDSSTAAFGVNKSYSTGTSVTLRSNYSERDDDGSRFRLVTESTDWRHPEL